VSGWPGDAPTVAESREPPEAMNDVGIGEIVDHYAQIISTPQSSRSSSGTPSAASSPRNCSPAATPRQTAGQHDVLRLPATRYHPAPRKTVFSTCKEASAAAHSALAPPSVWLGTPSRLPYAHQSGKETQ
jgi:hypothetical protein